MGGRIAGKCASVFLITESRIIETNSYTIHSGVSQALRIVAICWIGALKKDGGLCSLAANGRKVLDHQPPQKDFGGMRASRRCLPPGQFLMRIRYCQLPAFDCRICQSAPPQPITKTSIVLSPLRCADGSPTIQPPRLCHGPNGDPLTGETVTHRALSPPTTKTS